MDKKNLNKKQKQDLLYTRMDVKQCQVGDLQEPTR